MRIALFVGFIALFAACSAHSPPATTTTPAVTTAPAATPATASKNLKAPGEAKIGDTTKCPISGEEFVVSESSPHAEHNGKTYYFCCPDCAQKFQSDPAKYAHGA